MRQYELMLIIDPRIGQSELKDLVNRSLKVIGDNKDAVIKIDIWGKRHLAYPINHYTEASYVVIDFEAKDSKLPAELSRQLKINDDILRFKLLRKDE